MEVKVTGKTKKLTRKETKEIAQYFASKMMSKRLTDTLTVTINFVQLPNDKHGDAIWLDENNRRPKEYELNISPAGSRKFQIKTIAHEMAHVKQWATGEKVDHHNGTTVNYRGKTYTPKEDESDYWLLPWEVEAHGFEHCLYQDYKANGSTLHAK